MTQSGTTDCSGETKESENGKSNEHIQRQY